MIRIGNFASSSPCGCIFSMKSFVQHLYLRAEIFPEKGIYLSCGVREAIMTLLAYVIASL